jgi:hypothetical protein
LRLNALTEPPKRFVPERVIALTEAPVNPFCRTSKGASTTCSSWIASRVIAFAPAWPLGEPLAERPNRSLLAVPSIWSWLKRLFRPPPLAAPVVLLVIAI